MPDHPAPPAPTPTMAEAIAEMEHMLRHTNAQVGVLLENELVQRAGGHIVLADSTLDRAGSVARRGAVLSHALSAMRAVEAGPVCYAATRRGHPVLPNAIRAHRHEAKRLADLLGPEFYVVDLATFPSPDGGSAT